MSRLLHLCAFAWCGMMIMVAEAHAQRMRFEAVADPPEVVLGSSVSLRFTLYDARGSEFVPPDLSAFDVVMGPNQSFRTTIVNGRVRSEMSISYTLMPRKVGTFPIGPARIRVGGKTVHSNKVEIRVLPPTHVPSDSEALPDVFVELVLSDTVAYVGQELLVDLKLFTKHNIDSYSILDEPELKGAWVEPLRRFDTRTRHEFRQGVQYLTKVLRRMAVFPQQLGLLEIPPWRLQLAVVEGQDRGLGFFFNTRVRPVVVETQSYQVQVRPLPMPPPADFSGAVGEYAVKMRVQPSRLSTDQTLQLLWIVSGVGDIKRVEPPPVPLSTDSFDVYEPRVIEETIYEDQGVLRGKKVFEVLAIPRYVGQWRIVPSFSWFDVDSVRYQRAVADPFFVEVMPGDGLQRTLSDTATTADRPGRPYPWAVHTHLRKDWPNWWGSWSFWLLLVLPWVGGAMVIGSSVWLARQPVLSEAARKQRAAYKLARQRLSQAKKYLAAKAYRDFYDVLSRALIEYVAFRLQLPMAEVAKATVEHRLSEKGVPPQLRSRYMQLLEWCDKALYAGQAQQLPHEQLYAEALEVIAALEPYLRLQRDG